MMKEGKEERKGYRKIWKNISMMYSVYLRDGVWAPCPGTARDMEKCGD